MKWTPDHYQVLWHQRAADRLAANAVQSKQLAKHKRYSDALTTRTLTMIEQVRTTKRSRHADPSSSSNVAGPLTNLVSEFEDWDFDEEMPSPK